MTSPHREGASAGRPARPWRSAQTGPWAVVRERRSDVAWVEPDRLAAAIIEELWPEVRRARAPSAGSHPRSELAPFQEDALQRARVALDRYGGVLLADDVGTGKTFAGGAFAARAVASGRRVLAVGPAALRSAWVGTGAEWMSYARLSRGGEAARYGRFDLVLFDEAHALRNPRTRRYRRAAALTAHSPVVLLSATPVNNSVWDLYHLIRLFAGDGSFRRVGVASLHAAFEHAASTIAENARDGSSPPAEPDAALRPVLREILVRRTRPFARRVLREHAASSDELRFPTRGAPFPVQYDGETARRVAEGIVRLRFPLHSLGAGTARSARALLRMSLLKRLESSRQAASRSLGAYAATLERGQAAVRSGRLPSLRIRAADGVDPLQLSFAALLDAPAPAHVDLADAARRIAAERRRVADLVDWLTAGDDTKLAQLRLLLRGRLAARKCIVFSGYRDTAMHLARSLAPDHRIALITGSDAWLGTSPAGRTEVVRRFAPRSNGAPEPAPSSAVDVLIATDVLAEGLNLQDASAVVSYDLPWNPVRLLQRIGRIDRLGSPHERIDSYHFLPQGVDEYLRLVARLRRKLSAAHSATGPTAPVLHTGVVDAIRSHAGLERLEQDEARWFEARDRIVHTYRRWSTRPGAARQSVTGHGSAEHRPVRGLAGLSERCTTWCSAVPGPGPYAAIVVYRLEGTTRWMVLRDGAPGCEDDGLLERLLIRALDATGAARSDLDGIAAVVDRARRSIARDALAVLDRSIRRAGGPERALATRLLVGMARLPGGPPLPLCQRADRLLARLSGGVPAGVGLRLQRLLRDAPRPPDTAASLERLLAAAEDCAGSRSAPAAGTGEAELLAVLVVARRR